jgi:hypothetical protein
MNPPIPANPNPPFFGVKVSQPGVDVNNATPNQLLYKNDYSAQTFFGTNGDIAFGIFTSAVTGNQTMGMQLVDNKGNVTFEMDGRTWYWFDASGNIVMEVGYLSIAQIFGWAVAVPGQTLAGVV